MPGFLHGLPPDREIAGPSRHLERGHQAEFHEGRGVAGRRRPGGRRCRAALLGLAFFDLQRREGLAAEDGLVLEPPDVGGYQVGAQRPALDQDFRAGAGKREARQPQSGGRLAGEGAELLGETRRCRRASRWRAPPGRFPGNARRAGRSRVPRRGAGRVSRRRALPRRRRASPGRLAAAPRRARPPVAGIRRDSSRTTCAPASTIAIAASETARVPRESHSRRGRRAGLRRLMYCVTRPSPRFAGRGPVPRGLAIGARDRAVPARRENP